MLVNESVMIKGDGYEGQVLTIIRCSCVELLRQEAVVSEALHCVSHRDHWHHEQPAPQHIQKATHPSPAGDQHQG